MRGRYPVAEAWHPCWLEQFVSRGSLLVELDLVHFDCRRVLIGASAPRYYSGHVESRVLGRQQMSKTASTFVVVLPLMLVRLDARIIATFRRTCLRCKHTASLGRSARVFLKENARVHHMLRQSCRVLCTLQFFLLLR